MNMRGAFLDTIALAEAQGMPRESVCGNPDLGLDHLRDMNRRVTNSFSEAKLGRWLGWAQCALVASGCASLDDVKAINLKWAEG